MYIYNDKSFLQNVFVRRPKISKFEAHGFIYKIASRMLLTITHNCSCHPMEKSTNRTRYAYSMVLISSRDLVDGDIWDICCQTLQVLLDRLVVTSIPSCYLDCFPSSLNGGCTWRRCGPTSALSKSFLLVLGLKT
jgi:hypothetical protein